MLAEGEFMCLKTQKKGRVVCGVYCVCVFFLRNLFFLAFFVLVFVFCRWPCSFLCFVRCVLRAFACLPCLAGMVVLLTCLSTCCTALSGCLLVVCCGLGAHESGRHSYPEHRYQ